MNIPEHSFHFTHTNHFDRQLLRKVLIYKIRRAYTKHFKDVVTIKRYAPLLPENHVRREKNNAYFTKPS